MKKLFIVFAVSCALLTGCTKSSSKKDSNKDFLDKSIAEKLTVKELSSIIEDDSTFAGRYELIRSVYDNLPETQQATYYNITYKGLNEFYSQYSHYADFYFLMNGQKSPNNNSTNTNDTTTTTLPVIDTAEFNKAAADLVKELGLEE
ncbi:MAG: hypothetical protein J6X86_00735 [Bacteroidales bacterium]|nr:hypothetical protein [Bacteroidales bacterium]